MGEDYHFVTNGAAGAIAVRDAQLTQPRIYFHTTDIDASVRKVVEFGGEGDDVQSVPDVGRIAHCADDQARRSACANRRADVVPGGPPRRGGPLNIPAPGSVLLSQAHVLGESMEHFRPVGGLGRAATALVGLAAVGNVAATAADWLTYTTVRDYRAGAGTAAGVSAADKFTVAASAGSSLLTLLAGVVFISWLYNARINAELVTPATEHRRSRLWVWLGWFVPVVNLWYPKQVVDDVWRASDPRQQDVPLRQRAQDRLTTRWWAPFLVMWIFGNSYLRGYNADGSWTTDSFLNAAVLSTISALAGIIAAVLTAQLVRRISEFQSAPPPVA
ncbi:DUF4328 domain-containing protein [Lentzea sp.]|uniref:DUF4328 domain-containing protein n=1 Tax=Lentzea sp. TaxID=56099 RepID=UPI002B9E7B3C|nr:DUF4328 domain-containing protein [Lentzea sp.]HUQ55185.1 DUF4328 domain-containing protein [Lentzea sp.]